MSLDISDNMLAPMEVNLDFYFTPTDDNDNDKDYGLTATISIASNYSSYLWILDGKTQTNTNSILFLTHLETGRIYQLTVIVTD